MVNSLLISPNLGHPLILNKTKISKSYNFVFHTLFISNLNDLIQFKQEVEDKIKIVPIFDIIFTKKLKFRLKKLLIPKKHEVTPKPERGSKIIPEIIDIELSHPISIGNPSYIEDEYCQPQKYLYKNKLFDDLRTFYKVTLKFNLTKEIIKFLKNRNFILFDIIHGTDDLHNRINSHSLIISKNPGKNIRFIQLTDLHIADRNDFLYGSMEKWIKEVKKESDFKDVEANYNSKFKFLKKLRRGRKKKNLELDFSSFKKRLINSNNMLRKAITIINKKVRNNKVDFVAITGDIIDFSIRSTISKDIKQPFDYEKSNWQIFKDIILNTEDINEKGVIKGEELLCPIFTILGNHDYRLWHYDLRWGGMYKKIGLNSLEADALNVFTSANPIKSIIKSNSALDGYISEICSSLNYSFSLGKNLFIFLNSGSDSFKKLKALISGSPSLTGLYDGQIRYLNNLIKHNNTHDQNIFLFLHGPPINTKHKRGFKSRVKKWLGMNIKITLNEFRKSVFKKGKKNIDNAVRIDDKFDIKHGIVAYNWEELMSFCSNYCTLILCGHTHMLKEYRLKKINQENPNGNNINSKSLESNMEIYYNDYSELYTSRKNLKTVLPLIVQTPALGLKAHKRNKYGAYREIKIKKNKLSSLKVKYVEN